MGGGGYEHVENKVGDISKLKRRNKCWGGGVVTFGRKLAGGGGHQLHLWGTIGGGGLQNWRCMGK